MKECKNEKKLRNYDKERNIEVHRADDSVDRDGDSDGIGSYLVYGVLTKETEDVQLGTLCFVLYVVMEDVPQGLDDADGEADVVGDDFGLAAQLASEP